MIAPRFTPAPFPAIGAVADKPPPTGPQRPSLHGPTGPTPPGGGAGKPSPAHGVPNVGGTRPGKLSPAAGLPAVPGSGQAKVDRAMLLKDVMDHAVRVHKETTGPQGVGKGSSVNRSVVLAAVCVPLLAFCVYSWVARPEFLWGPKSGPLPAVQQEANVRFAMFLLAQRIQAYRAAQGHYPATLGELGETVPGVTYSLGNDGVFQIRASENGKAIEYRSDQSLNAFLGNSFNVIQGTAR